MGQGDRCMCSATCCCYTACDCTTILCLCKTSQDFLCIRQSCCLALNAQHKGCGCTTDKSRGECCKLGCFCCDYGLIWPTKVCGCASQICCCIEVGSFPCSEEYVPECVCTILCPGLQICPECGCCAPPPPCPALDRVLKDEHPTNATMRR